ncbi:uncharacterized protein BO87DRAFT_79462 [Aspergillus neoniger CBS 115656]|uniref:Uncharacterized protein n=1 Tax=Aspergillus neoniger (strain CBS 115656) TaxID=1448310 RepID=A0A318YWK9_ASPNB|nr:hypothetical protein BO87DRAFT_79462 [Aspergillus neoniger CBS 115656]PYH39265.1 hypothetical protein BO87DRAFT_79462 [Aspergillus neoniger CBS 115656]
MRPKPTVTWHSNAVALTSAVRACRFPSTSLLHSQPCRGGSILSRSFGSLVARNSSVSGTASYICNCYKTCSVFATIGNHPIHEDNKSFCG